MPLTIVIGDGFRFQASKVSIGSPYRRRLETEDSKIINDWENL